MATMEVDEEERKQKERQLEREREEERKKKKVEKMKNNIQEIDELSRRQMGTISKWRKEIQLSPQEQDKKRALEKKKLKDMKDKKKKSIKNKSTYFIRIYVQISENYYFSRRNCGVYVWKYKILHIMCENWFSILCPEVTVVSMYENLKFAQNLLNIWFQYIFQVFIQWILCVQN